MIDKNYYMESSRNCPENKSIPVCNIINNDERLGGTANVAVNLKNLGHNINIVSFIGDDSTGSIIINKLLDKGFNIKQIVTCKNRKSVEKNRYYLGNKLLFRYDKEDTDKINCINESSILENLDKLFKNNIDLVVISDYNKGLITKNILDKLKILCNCNNTRIIVDPKPKNINLFNNVYLLKPNLEEMTLIYENNVNLDNILEASKYVANKYNINYIATSLSKDGIYLYDTKNDTGKLYNDKLVNKNEVIDVTGAGDIVLSIIAHNINDLDNAIINANIHAQESTKHIGVMYL